ncbi:hypothetical protein [Acanthopleuribacter pedis]|uniref:Uncharacterized protein n=1 Tax=Acanthopleuribacter pedis TaxID=442870 RepID=A0A8J7QFT7_9BACT|nr:hypothetical protein [Acanthopleuribacter pedis]MBO1319706.1 hypothetical protein [Acanthopleuribacter pedis]
MDALYRREVLQDIKEALARRGLDDLPGEAAQAEREEFEEGYLFGRLQRLCQLWRNDDIHQYDFQVKALTIHALINEYERGNMDEVAMFFKR